MFIGMSMGDVDSPGDAGGPVGGGSSALSGDDGPTPEQTTQTNAGLPPEAVPEWAKEFTPEVRDLIASRKYNDPESLAQAYFHANQKLGGDASKLFAIPDGTNSEESGKFWTALGRPETADGYTIEFEDAPDAGQKALIASLQPAAWELGLSDTQWTGLLEKFSEAGAGHTETLTAAKATQDEAGRAEMRAIWGSEWDANMAKIDQAAAHLGLDEATLMAIKDAKGVKGALEWGLGLHRMVGEPNMDFGDSPGGGKQFMDPAGAKAKHDALLSNPEFATKYNAGEAEAVAQIHALVDIFSQESKEVLR